MGRQFPGHMRRMGLPVCMLRDLGDCACHHEPLYARCGGTNAQGQGLCLHQKCRYC